jgi:diguanylate cyclase (GGDEF)-like protein/PAS domain S-box-containing protein
MTGTVEGQAWGDPATGGRTLEAPARATSLEDWIGNHPSALVCALNAEGTPVEMPPGIPLLDSHQVDDRSFLELVDPAEAAKVVSAFLEARNRGSSRTEIRLAGADPGHLTLQYFDARDRYGVLLRFVVVDDEGGDATVQPQQIRATRPRLGIIEKNNVSAVIGIDDAVSLLLGWQPEEMIGHQTLEFIHPDDQSRAIDNWMEFIRVGAGHTVRLRYLCRDSSWLWVEVSNEFRDAAAPDRSVICQIIDISEEMAATEALRHSEQLLRRITETVPVGIAELATDRSVTYCNNQLRLLLAGYKVASLEDLLAACWPDDSRALERAISSALDDGIDQDVDIRLLGHGREVDRQCRVALRALSDDDRVRAALLCVMDVTELKVQAATDPLTGVQNRSAILEAVRAALRDTGNTAVLFLDLDHFKPVNDEFGHEVGDRLLAEIGRELRAAVRDGDLVGRIGGDEFLVVCPQVSSAEHGVELAGRLQRTVAMCAADMGMTLGASIGVAWTSEESLSPEELVGRADAAMYAAKRAGTGLPVLWEQLTTDGARTGPPTVRT